MRLVAIPLSLTVLLFVSAVSATANEKPSYIFYVAVRAPNLDRAPRYVNVSDIATAEQHLSVHGCNGRTYYASRNDASVVRTALAKQNIVELLTALTGTDPQRAGVVCVMK